jgi:hypothetical protein
MDSRGRAYVVSEFMPGTVSVFGSDGRLTQNIGRLGEGPGEFSRRLSVFLDPGDSLHVFDGGIGRETVYSPDHALVRMTRVEGFPTAAIFADPAARIVSMTTIASRPLSIVASSGETLRSFGTLPGSLSVSSDGDQRRTLSAAGTGRFWAAQRYQYILELWDRGGSLVSVLVRSADWFPTGAQRPTSGSSTTLIGVHQDPEGRIWTLSLVPEAPEGKRAERWDGIVEVIDPARRIVIGKYRFDDVPIGFARDGVIATYNDKNIEYEFLNLWRVRVGVIH